MGNALDRLGLDDLCIVVLKETAQRRHTVWVAHTKYFQFRDLPPGTADLHEVGKWWPIKAPIN